MKKNIVILFLALILSVSLFSQKIPDLKGHVNDYAGVLSSSEEKKISALLSNLEKSTSAQVALLTVKNLQGYPLETFSLKVAEEWNLGQKDRDNGIVVLLAMEEKKVRIEVGYGLEGSMTDIKSGYIIRNIILPEFRKGDFGSGLYKGLEAINGVVTNTSDITEEELRAYDKEPVRSGSRGIPFNLIIFVIIFFISRLARGRRGGGLFTALFLGSMLGGSHRSGSGGFSGGSFGGGGFSGGGGGFGGGGASGGW